MGTYNFEAVLHKLNSIKNNFAQFDQHSRNIFNSIYTLTDKIVKDHPDMQDEFVLGKLSYTYKEMELDPKDFNTISEIERELLEGLGKRILSEAKLNLQELKTKKKARLKNALALLFSYIGTPIYKLQEKSDQHLQNNVYYSLTIITIATMSYFGLEPLTQLDDFNQLLVGGSVLSFVYFLSESWYSKIAVKVAAMLSKKDPLKRERKQSLQINELFRQTCDLSLK
ncbi:MAG: hypothetical protein H6625_00200 [Bdellovibrionaceae bacterium]|nr:hypothetical protein [Pseudobdellovibrionaceae bacterium]